ncbi:MAG TPA: hypothetical protein VIY90_21285 [Steroidobacteraceae bacterium]
MLILAACTNARAQSDSHGPGLQKPVTLNDILKMTAIAQQTGNELTVLDILRDTESQLGTSDPHARIIIAQVASHFDAVVGNYREALHDFSISNGSKHPDLTSDEDFPLRGLQPKPALAVLDPIVNKSQIVMINEAHHVPQHRAFAIQLLGILRKRGFRYFAAETLSAEDSGLQSRGYPVEKPPSGYYTAEPLYGDLVRTALQLGFRVIPYEAAAFRNSEEREQGEAANLVQRVFKNDPRAKLVIYAGFSHINEGGLLGGVTPLAKRLRDITGIDPLTIDQTVMSEQYSPEYENPIYRYLMAHSPILEPTIFVNAQGEPWTFQPGVRDITLFQPRSVYVNGRPQWLSIGGTRKPYRLPASICGQAKRCLAKARAVNESEDAIPIDELAIEPEGNSRTLMLPNGVFAVESQDAQGHLVNRLRIEQH